MGRANHKVLGGSKTSSLLGWREWLLNGYSLQTQNMMPSGVGPVLFFGEDAVFVPISKEIRGEGFLSVRVTKKF